MIDDAIALWHAYVRGERPDALAELLDDDVVFHSPIVFTPQEGKAITTAYLQAATQVLTGDREDDDAAFHYTKDVRGADVAVLEFETTLDGVHVNGVDIISCNEAGRIVEFRVMLRPLKAVNAVHQHMARALGAA